jgi:hypothetical protein
MEKDGWLSYFTHGVNHAFNKLPINNAKTDKINLYDIVFV